MKENSRGRLRWCGRRMMLHSQRIFLSRWCPYLSFSLLLMLIFILWVWRICAIHRIFSFSDIAILAQTFRAPAFGPRCKEMASYNSKISHLRCLPNVFFIGASKTGTTSLVSYLQSVPGVYFTQRHLIPMDKHKEVHRFDRPSYDNSIAWFELLHEWASSPLLPGDTDGEQSLVVHYTPHYLYAPTVPFDIATLFPPMVQSDLRFLVTLRDSVERTVSSYWFKQSHLFQKEDRGSTEDMWSTISKDVSARPTYELCMLQYHRDHARYHMSYSLPKNIRNSSEVRESYLQMITVMVENAQRLLKFEFPSVRYYEHHPVPSNVRISGLFFLQEDHRLALKQCFGRKLRTASLGLRHVDKSIYVDQLARWLLHFPFDHFVIVHSRELAEHPGETLERVLHQLRHDKLHMSHRQNWSEELRNLNFNASKLVRPNHLHQSLSIQEHQLLQGFFEPYQAALNLFLAKMNP